MKGLSMNTPFPLKPSFCRSALFVLPVLRVLDALRFPELRISQMAVFPACLVFLFLGASVLSAEDADPAGKCQVSGIVKDKDGKPLKDVRISASMKKPDGFGYDNVAETRTAADGNFIVPNLRAGSYQFFFLSGTKMSAELESEVGDDLNYIDVILKESATIEGKVVDDGGNGLKGASISIIGNSRSTLSGDDGNYSLAGMVPGNYWLMATLKGYAMQGADQDKWVQITDARTYHHDIKLVRPGSIVVELEAGDKDVKVPGKISITLSSNGENSTSIGLTPVEVKESLARFEDIAPGKYTVVLESDEAAKLKGDLNVEAGKDAKIKFTLPKIYSIKGKILDDKGAPLRAASIMLPPIQIPGGAVSGGYASSGADGAFEIKNLEAGEYEASIQKEGFRKTKFKLAAGPGVSEPAIIKLDKGLAISGSVLEADGKPAAGIKITLSSPSSRGLNAQNWVHMQTESSQDGSFTFAGLSEGGFNLAVADPVLGYELASVENVAAGTEDSIITLSPKFQLVGWVGASDAPLKDVEVSASIRRGGQFFFGSGAENAVKTDKDGKFILYLRNGSKFSLKFSHPAYLEKTISFDPASGSGKIQVNLDKGCSVSGMVVRAKDNSPVEGVLVQAGTGRMSFFSGGQDRRKDNAKTDKSGKFKLDTVPYGIVKISILNEKTRLPLFSQSREIMANLDNNLLITLPEMLEVSGRIIDADGKPIPHAMVNMNGIDNAESFYNADTDGDGAFKIKDVLPGKYYATFFSMKEVKGGAYQANPLQIVEVKAENAAGLILRQKGGAEGKIPGTLKVNGKPVESGNIMFFPRREGRMGRSEIMQIGMEMSQSELSADGKFEVNGMIPGKYMFQVSAGYDAAEGMNLIFSAYAMQIFCVGAVEVKEGIKSLDIDLKGVAVSGRIEDVEGKPVRSANIQLQSVEKSVFGGMMAVKASSLKDGNFYFDCVEPGKYKLMAASEGSGLLTRDIAVDKSPVTMDIKLPKGFKLSGKIAVPEGEEPASGGSNPTVVMAFSKDGEMMAGIMAEGDSYAVKPDLPQGEYVVLAGRMDSANESAVLKVEKDTVLDFKLVPAGSLELRLKSGKIPVKDRKVLLKDQDGKEVMQVPENAGEFLGLLVGESNTVSDESGKILISGLKPGGYSMGLEGCKISPDRFEIRALEKAEVEAAIE